MSTIVTRSGKGTPLTNTEVDANFTNLNTDKLELSGGTLTGNLSLGDNVKLQLGNQTDGDLQIYHDGSYSWIKDAGTGSLIVAATNLSLQNAATTKVYANFNDGGSSTIHYDGSPTLATTSSGISVTGSVVADGLTVSGTGYSNATFTSSYVSGGLTTYNLGPSGALLGYIGNAYQLFSGSTSDFAVRAQSDLVFATGGNNQRQRIASNGDISFYNSAGSSQNLFWDSSTSRLGLGTTVPDVKLHISGTSGDAIMRLERNDNTITTNDVYGEIQFEGQDASAGSSSGIRGKIVGVAEDTTGAMGLSFETAGGYGSSTERLRIKGDGSSVFSGAVTSTGLTVDGTGYATLNFHSETTGSARYGSIRKNYDSPYDMRIRASNSTDAVPLIFEVSNSLEALKISSTANVNIPNGGLMVGSTTAPSAKLDVLGYNNIAKFYSTNTASELKIQTPTVNVIGLYTGTADALAFGTADSERMRIRADGEVEISGIGNTTGARLNVGSDASNAFVRSYSTAAGMLLGTTNAQPLKIMTNSGEVARFDSSGNLIVSGTAAGQATSVALHNTGYVHAVSSHQMAGIFDRRDSDGDIVIFRKDGSGTAVGSIGTEGNDLAIGNGDVGLQFINGGQTVRGFNMTTNARIDAQVDLGMASTRFKDLYLSGGVYLGGTGAANKLSDFETGSFTPTLGVGSGSITYAARLGTYTKVGRLVNCTIAISLSAVSSPSGTVSIFGLPFTNSLGEGYVSAISVGIARNFASALEINGYVNNNASTITLGKNPSNAGHENLVGGDLTSSTILYISIAYHSA